MVNKLVRVCEERRRFKYLFRDEERDPVSNRVGRV